MLSSIMCDNIEKYYANFFSNQNPILFPLGMPMMDTLTGLTPSYMCACPNLPRYGFPTSYVVALFMSNNLKWEMKVRFVDIGGIFDHHCFNFLYN